MLGSWPSVDPHNFSQFNPNDPTNPSDSTPVKTRERFKQHKQSAAVKDEEIIKSVYIDKRRSLKMKLITYHPTHERTLPPPDQVIGPEERNILLRHLYQHSEEKPSIKRTSSNNPTPERASKLPRTSDSDDVQ